MGLFWGNVFDSSPLLLFVSRFVVGSHHRFFHPHGGLNNLQDLEVFEDPRADEGLVCVLLSRLCIGVTECRFLRLHKKSLRERKSDSCP